MNASNSFIRILSEAANNAPAKDRATEAQIRQLAELAVECGVPITRAENVRSLTRGSADFMLGVLRDVRARETAQ